MPATFRRTIVDRLASGLRFTHFAADRGLGRAMARGAFEVAELACACRHVRPGDTAIDGGAHLGIYSLLLAQAVGPAGHVYAFEPHPESRTLLAGTVAANGFQGRITVREAALGAQTQPATLLSGRRCAAHAHAHLAPAGVHPGPSERTFPIQLVALDDLRLDRRVALLKLDVEGAELLAMRGALHLIRRDRPAILCELGDEESRRISGSSSDQVIETLREAGYAPREILPDGSTGRRLEAPPSARVSTVLCLPDA
jgi:FkbM family methyltransferase